MKNLTWQNPEQLFVAQELINKVKSKCCGIKDKYNFMNVKDIFSRICIGLSCIILNSCGSYYYCTLNSRGSSPSEKTYFLTSPDSTLNATLEFQEYAGILKGYLTELGYSETSSQDALLRIELKYSIGEALLDNSTTTESSYSYTYGNTNIKSNTKADANIKANVNANNNKLSVNTKGYGESKTNTKIGQANNALSFTTYETPNTYKIPLLVSIKSFNNKSNNPIWEVVIKDDLKRETQMQSVMPWLLLGAKEYIGKSSNGEQTVKIDNKKEVKEKYKLVWPY